MAMSVSVTQTASADDDVVSRYEHINIYMNMKINIS